jgi:hypothetical protein
MAHAEDDVSVPAEPATLNLESTNGPSVAVYPPALTGSGATVPGSAQHLQLAGNEVADLDAPFEPLPMAATAVAARKANRRRDVRSRVSFTACVVQDGVEEIVECGNVSKGGFSFRSRKAYLAGSDIDVVLPYYPGTTPAFVLATIRHALVLPNNNFHYGVMYAATNRIPRS